MGWSNIGVDWLQGSWRLEWAPIITHTHIWVRFDTTKVENTVSALKGRRIWEAGEGIFIYLFHYHDDHLLLNCAFCIIILINTIITRLLLKWRWLRKHQRHRDTHRVLVLVLADPSKAFTKFASHTKTYLTFTTTSFDWHGPELLFERVTLLVGVCSPPQW